MLAAVSRLPSGLLPAVQPDQIESGSSRNAYCVDQLTSPWACEVRNAHTCNDASACGMKQVGEYDTSPVAPVKLLNSAWTLVIELGL